MRETVTLLSWAVVELGRVALDAARLALPWVVYVAVVASPLLVAAWCGSRWCG